MSLANAARKAAAKAQAQTNRQTELGGGRSTVNMVSNWRSEMGTETPGASPILTDSRYLSSLGAQRASWQVEVGDENPDYMGGLLFRYLAGDVIAGESYSRTGVATYIDQNGIVQTALTGVKRDNHYIAGARTTLLEDTRNNNVLWCRDLTNAAWVKTTMNAVAVTGADGVLNSGTTITATGANATILQSITLGSAARAQSAWIKRVTGSGVVQMTMDNGVTWTPVTVTAGWTLVTIPTQTLANPIVGFRIVTSGDAVSVDYVQNENGTFSTSAIATTSGALARGVDLYSVPFLPQPQSLTVYAKLIDRGTIASASTGIFSIANSAGVGPRFTGYNSAGFYSSFHQNGGFVNSDQGVAPVVGDTIELAFRLYPNGSVDLVQSINGAAATTSTPSAGLAFAAAFSGALLWINSTGNGGWGFGAFQSLKVLAGVRTLAEMRTA